MTQLRIDRAERVLTLTLDGPGDQNRLTRDVLLGIGTAMVYPTLLAAIGDVARPSWRAASVGVYRLWRDLGYAIGALLAGLTADAFGLNAAMWLVALLTFGSGVTAGLRMTETLPSLAMPRSDSEAIYARRHA